MNSLSLFCDKWRRIHKQETELFLEQNSPLWSIWYKIKGSIVFAYHNPSARSIASTAESVKRVCSATLREVILRTLTTEQLIDNDRLIWRRLYRFSLTWNFDRRGFQTINLSYRVYWSFQTTAVSYPLLEVPCRLSVQQDSPSLWNYAQIHFCLLLALAYDLVWSFQNCLLSCSSQEFASTSAM